MAGNSFFNLTDTELQILNCILTHIATTMRIDKVADFSLSRCIFVFELSNGTYDNFQSVFEKIRGTAKERTVSAYHDDRAE
jgi:hypothetical protein